MRNGIEGVGDIIHSQCDMEQSILIREFTPEAILVGNKNFPTLNREFSQKIIFLVKSIIISYGNRVNASKSSKQFSN